MTTSENNEPNERQWFVMRDLKRPNAKLPAYQQLIEDGFEVFTPMRWQIAERASACLTLPTCFSSSRRETTSTRWSTSLQRCNTVLHTDCHTDSRLLSAPTT